MTVTIRNAEFYRDHFNVLKYLLKLHDICQQARKEGHLIEARLIARDATLLINEIIRKHYSWIFADLPWTDLALPAQEQTARSRPSARSVRNRQKIADPLELGCVIPPDLAGELYLALRALDLGEIKDLLAHVPTKQRGDAQEIAFARLAIVRHVHFLVGKGEAAKKAREIVSKVIHKSPDTIRSWETTELLNLIANVPDILERARRAGQIRRAFPNELPTSGFDDETLFMITDIEDLPLSDLQKRLASLEARPRVRNPLRQRHKKVLGKAALS
jgi:hypothetical protein